jgi:hypothetical protein
MDDKSNLKEINSRLKLFINLGFTFFLGVIEELPFFIENRQNPFGEVWLSGLTWFLIYSAFWFITINIVWYLESRYSIINNKFTKVIPLHVLIIIALISSNAALSTIQLYNQSGERAATVQNDNVNSPENNDSVKTTKTSFSAIGFFIARFVNSVPIVILIYSGIWGIGIGLNYYQKFQERAIRASELETQLAHSQLQTLKAQLQPHFLFNTLNGIVGLIRSNNNQAAIETINELSALLRYVVENAGKESVELNEELEFNQLFLNLHQKRFSDRMKVNLDIAPETLHLEVPNLILQPLVENAIVHGVSKSIAEQRVIIKSRIENDKLILSVKNDAPKLTAGWKVKRGVGLEITYSRLEKMYDGDFSFEIKPHENRCVIAEICIPIKKATKVTG